MASDSPGAKVTVVYPTWVLRTELEFMQEQDIFLTAEPSAQLLAFHFSIASLKNNGECVGLNWGHLVILTLLYSVFGLCLAQLCKYFVSSLEAEHKPLTFYSNKCSF